VQVGRRPPESMVTGPAARVALVGPVVHGLVVHGLVVDSPVVDGLDEAQPGLAG
jgi:hypothetical protein